MIKDVFSIPYEQVQREFRKMTYAINYANSYGQWSKVADDYQILRYKKFNQITIASILKPNVTACIERWLELMIRKTIQEKHIALSETYSQL